MAKAILRLVPLAQSITLAEDNLKFTKKKKYKVGDVVGQGMKTIIGVSIIKEMANVVEGF